jgi:predicted PurR-regulated permease PerM
MIGVTIFVFVGLLSIDALWLAFVPAGAYLCIHVIEGETVTPMLLARRFTINPVLVILSIVFWYWMWGVLGVILAMPMLAITKIILRSAPTSQRTWPFHRRIKRAHPRTTPRVQRCKRSQH